MCLSRATEKSLISLFVFGVGCLLLSEALRATTKTVVRILARRPDSSRERTSLRSVYVGLRPRSGSLRESHLSPHVSQSDVTSHSPRQNAFPQARTPRRQAIPSLLSCDCRLLRATGGLRRRSARICVHQEAGEDTIMASWMRDRPRRTERCVRSGRVGRAPSGERRADAVRRTRRERRAGRGADSAATKPRTGIRGCGRRERTPGKRERGRGRPARPRLRPKAEIAGAQRRPTADATNSTRDRQRGALRGRSGADCLPDEASWAGLRPAADLAVAARPTGRPSRPPGGGSTVATKRAARRQATKCAGYCLAAAFRGRA